MESSQMLHRSPQENHRVQFLGQSSSWYSLTICLNVSTPSVGYLLTIVSFIELLNSRDDALALQSDLDALHKWEKDWGMSFNPTKCNTISITRKKHPIHHFYSLKGVPLKAVEEAVYLGVMVAKDLSWGK